jgi:hypothetical protein
MKFRDSRWMAGLVVSALALPVHGELLASGDGGAEGLCADRQAVDCPLDAGSAMKSASAAQRTPDKAAVPGARSVRQAATAAVRPDPERAVPAAGDGAASLLFWVFGSGLIGLAFAARRRDVQPQDT